jgi:hypothetical protein
MPGREIRISADERELFLSAQVYRPMKTTHIAIALCAMGASLTTSATSLNMSFDEADSFTDFTFQSMSEERTASIFAKDVERALQSSVEKYLPEETALNIRFTDVDLAGDVQPWRNRNNADIRYVENIYPPRLKFTYQLLAADGSVLREGEENLSDLAFMMRAAFNIHRNNFYYETELLKDWLRELGRELKQG